MKKKKALTPEDWADLILASPILQLRILFSIGIGLGLFSWAAHGFSCLGSARITWGHSLKNYHGIPIRASYSGPLDGRHSSIGSPVQTDKSITGQPLRIAGVAYLDGLGTQTPSKILLDLDRAHHAFSCGVGVDGDVDHYQATIFRIFADGKKVFESGPMMRLTQAQSVHLDVSGVKTLCLQADPASYHLDPDRADWVDLRWDRSADTGHSGGIR